MIQSILILFILLRGLDDWTALHFASNEGNLDIVNILIKHGAKIDALTKFQRTPFFLTVM